MAHPISPKAWRRTQMAVSWIASEASVDGKSEKVQMEQKAIRRKVGRVELTALRSRTTSRLPKRTTAVVIAGGRKNTVGNRPRSTLGIALLCTTSYSIGGGNNTAYQSKHTIYLRSCPEMSAHLTKLPNAYTPSFQVIFLPSS